MPNKRLPKQRVHQYLWTAHRRRCCLYIIENPLMKVEVYAHDLGVTKKYIQECYELLNMPISKKPADCVGTARNRRNENWGQFMKNIRDFARSNGLLFKNIRDNGASLGWAFIDDLGNKSPTYSTATWRDLYDRNQIFEVLGLTN